MSRRFVSAAAWHKHDLTIEGLKQVELSAKFCELRWCAYATAPLKNPSHDARDVGAKLRNHGFDVTLGTDWTQGQMEEAIRTFGDRLRGGGVGLFYFAGHGIQTGGRNYLVPVDARIKSDVDVKCRAPKS